MRSVEKSYCGTDLLLKNFGSGRQENGFRVKRIKRKKYNILLLQCA